MVQRISKKVPSLASFYILGKILILFILGVRCTLTLITLTLKDLEDRGGWGDVEKAAGAIDPHPVDPVQISLQVHLLAERGHPLNKGVEDELSIVASSSLGLDQGAMGPPPPPPSGPSDLLDFDSVSLLQQEGREIEPGSVVGDKMVADQLLAQTVVTKQKWDGSDKKKCHLWTQGLDQSFKVSSSLLHSLKQLGYFL